MKVLYISNHDLTVDSGVTFKIKNQVKAWKQLDTDVLIFSVRGLKVFNADGELVNSFSNSNKYLSRHTLFTFLFGHIFSLWIAFRFKPDIIYSRSFLFSPFYLIMQVLFPTVIEINGDDEKELRQHNKVLFLYNHIFRPFHILASQALVCISNELKTRFIQFKKPIWVTGNAVSDSVIQFDKSLRLDSHRINIGLTGTDKQNWHGIDKAVEYVRIHKKFHLHIIGVQGANEENITFYGKVSNEINMTVLNSCHVCFSSLALHRKGMSEASPLKSREYLALGKPFIYAYNDTDLDQYLIHSPFLLKISNHENNIETNFHEITNFIENVSKEDYSKSMKLFAGSKLSFESKEKLKMNFLKHFMMKV